MNMTTPLLQLRYDEISSQAFADNSRGPSVRIGAPLLFYTDTGLNNKLILYYPSRD